MLLDLQQILSKPTGLHVAANLYAPQLPHHMSQPAGHNMAFCSARRLMVVQQYCFVCNDAAKTASSSGVAQKMTTISGELQMTAASVGPDTRSPALLLFGLQTPVLNRSATKLLYNLCCF